MRSGLIVLACICASQPASTRAASFTFRDFRIPGATSVNIAAINDFGVATGTYVTPAAPFGAGFAGLRNNITTLANRPNGPGLGFNIPIPSGIDNSGTVIGSIQPDFIQTFLWRNGTYTAFLGGVPYGYPSFPPYLATADHVSYNEYETHGVFSAFAGIAGNEKRLPLPEFSTVASTNRRFEVAGEYTVSVGKLHTTAVFFGGPRKVMPLLPPDATSSHGGWLNDFGQVAGSYQNKAGGYHGFIYAAGSYKSFDMPVRIKAISVQGIDISGRVVGAYTDRFGEQQHGFLYSHGTVTPFGNASPTDKLHVSISHFGRAIALSVTKTDGTATSYLVRCVEGPGNC